MTNVLISNDDGVHAPGIKALYKAVQKHCRATIVAPLEERSTTGHTLSLDHPLRLQKVQENVYGCTGFPGDCVLMGIGHICKEQRPDLVLTGINRGANLGQDLYYSGTVAAAREAAFHGIPSVAMSLACEFSSQNNHFETAAYFAEKMIQRKIEKLIPSLTVMNINIPNLPTEKVKGVKFTTIGFRDYSEQVDERIDSRNRKYYWVAGIYRGYRQGGETDCEAVSEGYVSITPHHLVDSQPRDEQRLREFFEELKDIFPIT